MTTRNDVRRNYFVRCAVSPILASIEAVTVLGRYETFPVHELHAFQWAKNYHQCSINPGLADYWLENSRPDLCFTQAGYEEEIIREAAAFAYLAGEE